MQSQQRELPGHTFCAVHDLSRSSSSQVRRADSATRLTAVYGRVTRLRPDSVAQGTQESSALVVQLHHNAGLHLRQID
jgi:hypothetical protein